MRPILRSLPRGLPRSPIVSSTSTALPLRRLPPNLSCHTNPYVTAWRLQSARSFASKPEDGTTDSKSPIAMPPPPGSVSTSKQPSSSPSPASTNSSTESSATPKSDKSQDSPTAGKPTKSEEAVKADKKDTVDKEATGGPTHSDVIQEAMKNLPSQLEAQRSEASKRFSKAMDDLQTALFSAGQKINDLTGYSEIQILKNSIEQQEENVKASRAAVQKAKEDYQSAISRRSASQREVNELLQRKHAWSPTDLERFTSLYRNDHTNEQAEVRASEALVEAERVADEAQAQLSRSILARYHEEQIWSDKIRRASTWGTWGLMGFNVLLFIVVQLGLEPWKRKRLVGGFEEKVREVIQEENEKVALAQKGLMERHEEEKRREAEEARRTLEQEVMETAKDVQKELEAGAVAITATTELADIMAEREPIFKEPVLETLKHPDQWKGIAEAAARRVQDKGEELWSEKEVRVTQRDMTKVTLEAAAAGAVLSAVFTFLISQR